MQSFIDLIPQKSNELDTFYLPAGDGKIGFVDVRDIAAVAVQGIINNNDGRHNGRTFNITGPEAISFGDAANILSEAVGKKISYVNISEDDARKGDSRTDGSFSNETRPRNIHAWKVEKFQDLFGRDPKSF